MPEISATPQPKPKGVTNNQTNDGRWEKASGHLLSGAADMFQNLAEASAAGINEKLKTMQGKRAATLVGRKGHEETASAIASVGASGIRMSGSALKVIAASQRNTIRDSLAASREHRYKALAYKHVQRAGKTAAMSSMLTGMGRASQELFKDG